MATSWFLCCTQQLHVVAALREIAASVVDSMHDKTDCHSLPSGEPVQTNGAHVTTEGLSTAPVATIPIELDTDFDTGGEETSSYHSSSLFRAFSFVLHLHDASNRRNASSPKCLGFAYDSSSW